MGCVCDGGYEGADCSQRMCKTGVDPLYMDEVATIRYSNYTYEFYTQSASDILYGNYSLIFTDAHGHEWTTYPIPYNSSCAVVTDTLEALPNKVIPTGSVRCYKSEIYNGYNDGQDVVWVEPIKDASMFLLVKYTLAFPGNPGRLPQLGITTHLDGSRPTLYATNGNTVKWHVYPNGFIGEDVDMVPDYCEGVIVNLKVGSPTHYLDGIDTQEAKKLKRCLGDSDGDSSNNVDVYNWDDGDHVNPHLIKLVDATQYYPNTDPATDGIGCKTDCSMDEILKKFPSTKLCANSAGNKAKFGVDSNGVGFCSNLDSPGFYAVLYYDDVTYPTNPFRIYTRAAQDYPNGASGWATPFFVFTTTGHLQLVSEYSRAFTVDSFSWDTSARLAGHFSNVVHLSNDSTSVNFLNGYNGNIDCETNDGLNSAYDCLDKEDWVMFFGTKSTDVSDATHLAANPVYPNLYQVKKIFRNEKTYKGDPANPNSEKIRNQIVLDYGMNAKFNWEGGSTQATDTSAQVYKFYPPPKATNPDNGYKYVAQCSNRGICNHDSGLCECFHGYTSDNCGTINALAH